MIGCGSAAAVSVGSTANRNVVIELQEVSLDYRSGPRWSRTAKRAVANVSLAIAAEETVGLVGQSGSGKTSVARLMLGLARPSSGVVLFQGRPLGKPRERSGKLQAVFQNPAWSLDPRMTCRRSIAEPLTVLSNVSRAGCRRAVQQILQDVGLDASMAERHPHELSGGQRQRIAIARALISKPELVIFDEAVSALDVSVQAQILNLIRRLQAEIGFSALFISHNIAAARYVSDRVAVMLAGEVIETASSQDLYSQARHSYTRALLGLPEV